MERGREEENSGELRVAEERKSYRGREGRNELEGEGIRSRGGQVV